MLALDADHRHRRALVLVEDCIEPERIDVAEQRERLERAQGVIDEHGGVREEEGEEPSARLQQAFREKRRAETFLRIAGEQPA